MSRTVILFTLLITSFFTFLLVKSLPIRTTTSLSTRPSTYTSTHLYITIYAVPLLPMAYHVCTGTCTCMVLPVYYAGLLLTDTLTHVLKVSVRERRPHWREERHGYESFPSGHASTMSYMACGVECGWPVRVCMCVWALLVGLSRLIDEKHFVWDVLAGACIGCCIGCTIRRTFGVLYSK